MNQYALVTGASKGIGKHIAINLAERGYNLILLARSGEELTTLKLELESNFKMQIFTHALDISQPNSIEQIINLITANNLAVSVLVNNAGFGLYGDFEQQVLTEIQNMLDLNIKSLVALTHSLLPVLKHQKNSYILNVASTAAFQAVPFMGVYAATKAFVLSFSRALRFELKASKISVSCLCPGPVKTAFWDRAKAPSIEMIERISKAPEEIARVAVKGMFEKKSEIFAGGTNRLGAFSNRLLPKALVEKVAARLFATKG